MESQIESSNMLQTVSKIARSLEDLKIEAFKRKHVAFEEALKETGFGRYNAFLILVCGLLLFAANSEAYSVSYILPAAECDLNLDNYTKGMLTSANFIGIMSSCTMWGYLSDIKGRRKLLIINLGLAFLTGLVAAVVPSFWGFASLRLINGIFISGPTAVSFVYFGEFLCSNTRAKSMACVTLFIALALITLPSLGWFFLQKTFKLEFLGLVLNNWRTFMLINSVPSIIVALGLSRLPESPKYLYHSGRPNEALRVLKEMYSYNTGKPEDTFPVESLDENIFLERSSKKKVWRNVADQILPLFKPPLLTYTLVSCFIEAGTFALSSGLYFWYPDIITQVSNSGKISVTICQALSASGLIKETTNQCNNTVDNRVFVLTIIIGVAYLVAYTTWGVVVRVLGTRRFFMSCMAIAASSIILICFLSEKILIDIFFITALTLPGMSISLLNSWIVEIFPTYICGMALCTALTAGRLGSVVSSSIAGIMLEWNCLVTLILYGLSQIACLTLSLGLPDKK